MFELRVAAVNALEMEAAAIMEEINENGNENTLKTYKGAELEFLTWMRNNNRFPIMTRITVTEHKLLVFLHEEVVGRQSKRKRKNSEHGGTISIQTVKNYVSAAVKLWQKQALANINSNPNPRGNLVKQYLKFLKTKEFCRERCQFIDPGRGTLADGYTEEKQFEDLAEAFLETSTGIRDRALFLVTHYGFLRGDNGRMLEFSHFQCIQIPGVGPMKCPAIQLILQQSKTNHVNRKDTTAFIRAKNVLVCGVGGLALYMFERFHRQREEFPDLSDRKLWYQTKMFGIGYRTHAVHTKRAKKVAKIQSTKVTHIARKTAPSMIPFEDDRKRMRHGVWGSSAFDTCYANTIIPSVCLGLAGFSTNANGFFLPRASIDPPEELLALVFPELNGWLERNESGEGIDMSISTTQFLATMVFLRVVLLQDSVFLKKKYPTKLSQLWEDELFSHPLYKEFEERLLAATESIVDPNKQAIEHILPGLLENNQQVLSTMNSGFEKVLSEMEQLRSRNAMLTNYIHRVCHGTVSALNASLPLLETTVENDSFAPVNAVATVAQGIGNEYVNLERSSNTVDTLGPISYKMSRTICSVQDLWREWNFGLSGRPAVKDLERSFGTKWRSNPSESRYFTGRKVIIDEIERLVATNTCVSHDQAVNHLENKRLANKGSLNWLIKSIRPPKAVSNSE